MPTNEVELSTADANKYIDAKLEHHADDEVTVSKSHMRKIRDHLRNVATENARLKGELGTLNFDFDVQKLTIAEVTEENASLVAEKLRLEALVARLKEKIQTKDNTQSYLLRRFELVRNAAAQIQEQLGFFESNSSADEEARTREVPARECEVPSRRKRRRHNPD